MRERAHLVPHPHQNGATSLSAILSKPLITAGDRWRAWGDSNARPLVPECRQNQLRSYLPIRIQSDKLEGIRRTRNYPLISLQMVWHLPESSEAVPKSPVVNLLESRVWPTIRPSAG